MVHDTFILKLMRKKALTVRRHCELATFSSKQKNYFFHLNVDKMFNPRKILLTTF
jgi:hypothetical protein